MRNMVLLYDVSDINTLLERDITQVFYRLYGGVVRSQDELTPYKVVACWYSIVLDEDQKVLFSLKPRTRILELLGTDLYNAIRTEIHPAYRRLVCRMINIPFDLSHHEATGLTVEEISGGQQVLKIKYPDITKKELKLDARNTTHHEFGNRPTIFNELLLSSLQPQHDRAGFFNRYHQSDGR